MEALFAELNLTTSYRAHVPPPALPREIVSSDWRAALPVLTAPGITLRELEDADAPTLFAMLTEEEVQRFISPPPSTVDGFRAFIAWTQRQRAAGTYVCFGIVPDGYTHAVGLIQVRQLGGSFTTAEWGFILGSAFWGQSIFSRSAVTVIEFCFETLAVHRLEARASTKNTRGNGALRKLGASLEGTLRESFVRHGVFHDQFLWTIIDTRDREVRAIERPRMH
jgi:RimJ/RimL family protein N-acetyltransferase